MTGQRRYGITPLEDLVRDGGLAALKKIISGELPSPPISRTLNFHLVEAEHNRALFEGTPSAEFLNPLSTVHGGWAATLLDSALGCATQTTLAPGEAYTTVEFKVSLMRPITPQTGAVRCEGRIVHRGRRTAVSEATLCDAEGRLLAHGTETCMIFPLPTDGGAGEA